MIGIILIITGIISCYCDYQSLLEYNKSIDMAKDAMNHLKNNESMKESYLMLDKINLRFKRDQIFII